MRVVLVDALARGRYGRRIVTVDAIGAGPRTVAGVLESKGIDVVLYTAEHVFEEPQVLRGADALLVSAMSIDEPTVARLVRLWRRRARGQVIVGGPIASDPGFVLRVGADIGIHGEAEPVLDAIASKGLLERADPAELGRLCGVVYRSGDGLRVRPRCPIMPRRVWERYRPSTRVVRGYPLYWAARVYVEVVRGCSNYRMPGIGSMLPRRLRPDKPRPGCAYCSVVSLWGYARSRSTELVYEEVRGLIEQGVHRIVLSGPDFLDYGRDWLVEPRPLVDPGNPRPNVAALRGLLRRLFQIPEIASGEVSVMAENAKPNLVEEESAEVLGEYLKGTPIHVGAETGDDRLLGLLGRPARVRHVVRAVRLLRRYGLRPYIYVMYCLPGENRVIVRKTLRLMEQLYREGAEKITAYRFTPLPLSYLERLADNPPRCAANHPVKKKATEINIRAKRRLIGKVFNVIVAGTHPKYGKPVAYMLKHGPVVLLKEHGGAELGDILAVRITGVKGDHLATGVVLRRLGRARAAGGS